MLSSIITFFVTKKVTEEKVVHLSQEFKEMKEKQANKSEVDTRSREDLLLEVKNNTNAIKKLTMLNRILLVELSPPGSKIADTLKREFEST